MSEIRVNNIVAADGSSAPQFPSGFSLATGMGITNSPNLTGSAVTFSGLSQITNATDSTSSTTGSLVVTGGVGIAKNVYIGAGLSVAGTLTYEDVTNVDSVGLITAKSGVNITGGQLQVGVAYSVGAAGVATAAGFVGPLTGAVTGNADTATTATNVTVADESSDTTCFPTFVTAATGNLPPKSGSNLTFNSSSGLLSATLLGGTVNTAAQGSITSLGTLTGLNVNGDVSFSGDSYNILWDKSDNALEFADNAKAKFGTGADFSISHDGSDTYLSGDVDGLDVFLRSRKDLTLSCGNASSGYHSVLYADNNGAARLYHPASDAIRLQTTADGVNITGMTTCTTGAHFQGLLRENCNIVANKLSAGTNIDLEDGMIHYYSTNETTTATPNIRWNSSYSLNDKMSTGEAVTVTIIYKPNNAGYYASLTVDSSAATEEWNGGSAPSSANSGGYDVLTHTLVKTANGTFLCLSNVQNYA